MNNSETRFKQLMSVSDPSIVKLNLKKYLGSTYDLYISDKLNKKYCIFDISTNQFIHFGDLRYQDFSKHHDIERRERYLKRALNMKGDWKNNKKSPNNLAINLLWAYDSKKMN